MLNLAPAEEFGVSRFKIARLLDQALASGIVRIEIGVPAQIDTDLLTETVVEGPMRARGLDRGNRLTVNWCSTTAASSSGCRGPEGCLDRRPWHSGWQPDHHDVSRLIPGP